MAKLLVVTRFSDEHFESADYAFVRHQLTGLQRYFDEINVVAPTPYFPGWLRPFERHWEKLRLRMLKRDFSYGNIRVLFAPFRPWAGRLPGTDRVKGLWPAIQRTVRKHGLEYDIVHSHMTLGFGWHGLQLARQRGVPVALTVHESHDGLIEALVAKRWDALAALRESDALIRVTPTDIEQVRELSGTLRPIHYIPNGFDFSNVPTTSRDTLRAELGLPIDRKILVSVARWVDRKDPLTLIEGLARMQVSAEERPLLLMLGEDMMGGRIQKRIAERGLGDHVRLLGQRSPELVLAHMRASDAVTLYSLSEGNPTVMFEALGCGRPYISSDVGGVSAVLVDERLGLYGPMSDPDCLARMLERAMQTEWDEAYILETARQYTWEHLSNRIYDEVLGPLLRGQPTTPREGR